jgi:hypothetical protein
MGEIDSLDKILNSKKKAALTGPASQLKPIEDALLHYIFELREQGVTIDTLTVVLRASWISPEFRAKSFAVRCSCVKHFLHAHSYTYRMGTHTFQRPPAEVESKASNFMRFTHLIVNGSNRDWRFIINMDQTPVYFAMNAKRTLDEVGKKTIHVRTSTNDTKRVTVAVTITADGTVLLSTLVFKGKPNGRIAKTEFNSGAYPLTHFYKC